MSTKPKKVNQKKKNEKDPNKFHLGRNTGTALIFGGILIGLVLIYVVLWSTCIGKSSYLKVYNKNKVTAYKETYPDAIHKEASSFNELDVDFYCTSFDSKEAHKATFKVCIKSNKNTKDLIPITSSLDHNETSTATSSSLKVAYAGICLAANWVSFEKSTSLVGFSKDYVTKNEKSSSINTLTVNLDSDQVFPMKANTWPVKVKVNAPDAYLFIAFYYCTNGEYKLQQYVLHYTYNEYTKNDFNNFGITSPAI